MNNSHDLQTLMSQAQMLYQQGQLEDAASVFRNICALFPSEADAWHMLGAINGMLGAYTEAEGCARNVTILVPGAAAGHRNLGNILLQLENPAGAESSFRRALDIEPDNAEDRNNLGVALAKQEKYAEAAECYQQAILINSAYATAYFNLGFATQAQGLLDSALNHYKIATQLEPENEKFYIGLGNALVLAVQHDQALACLERALSIDPGNIDALCGAGAIHHEFGHLDKAISFYVTACDAHPECHWIHNLLGNAYREHGDSEKALQCYRDAVKLRPDLIDAHYNIGVVLEQAGRLHEALEQYRKIKLFGSGCYDSVGAQACILEKLGEFDASMELVSQDIDSGKAGGRTIDAFSRLCRHYDMCDKAILLLEDRLGDENLDVIEKRGFHFRLGQLYDRSKRYEEAFRHYVMGNTLKNCRYNADEDEAYTRSLIESYSQEHYACIPSVPPASDVTPIFIVGMPRSGTSLVEQIISSHPEVYAGDELSYLGRICNLPSALADSRERHPRYLQRLTLEICDQMAQEYLAELRNLAPGSRYVTDKMPHNFIYIGLINKLFPEAPIIHCVRNSVDVCVSCYFQDFAVHHNYAYDLSHLGMHYRFYQRVMDHFKNDLNIPMLEVHYERTVEDLEDTSRTLLHYCGLEWDDTCLDFHKSLHRTRTASYDQVRQPIYKQSVRRWRNYQQYLGPLFEALDITT
ncbi:tetratricopeptide repeat protein [Gammaproteobacteria bacterium]|nr:tetratricopeptide repeat protein [Gammaproteobacteria bacterium]